MAKLTAHSVEKGLREMEGNVSAVARLHGVTRQAVQGYIHRHPTLQAVCQECRETMKDNAESSLYSAVREKEGWAVCFYLKTQAKDRGYVERQEHEHTGKDGGPIEVREIVVSTREQAEALLAALPSPNGVSRQ